MSLVVDGSATPAVTNPSVARTYQAPRSWRCQGCDFALWIPLARLSVSNVGLYDDARFPGRLIVTLHDHYEHLDEVPDELMMAFTNDVRACSSILRAELTAKRTNVAILGNREAHIHAHIIPRIGELEPLPREAPWRDPRPRSDMPLGQRSKVIQVLTEALEALGSD